MSLIRPLLLLTAALGTLLFGAALLASLLDPGAVETLARNIIRQRVEARVNEKIDALDARFLAGRAAALLRNQQDEIDTAKRQLKAQVPERVAAEIARLRDLDCTCRQAIERNLRSGIESRIAAAGEMQERLGTLIRTQYMEVAEKLTREFRIFTGSNALVFALLGLAALCRRGAGLHLIGPAVVLVVAAAITGALYLFRQDWLHTILFNDYLGWGYVGYLSLVFAFLCDVLFNRARITTRLLNALFRSLQISLELAPC